MKTRERLVIYSILAALLLINLPAIVGLSTRTAYAAVSALAEALGPAEALILSGPDDQSLTIRNGGGHLAWDDSPYARTHSIAFVHIGKAIDGITRRDEYVEEFQQLEAEIQEHDEELRGRMNEFQREHADASANDPNAREVAQQAVALQEEYQQWLRERARRLGELSAQQLERAYRETVAAVEVVAQRGGIDIVYRFIPTDDEFQSRTPDQALTAIWSRVALKYPDELNITDKVLTELSLPVE